MTVRIGAAGTNPVDRLAREPSNSEHHRFISF
jgi:hypothetical protein